MKRVLIYLKNYKKQLILGPFFKLLEAVFELIVPVVMAKIIDNGIGNSDTGYIIRMGGVMVILGICGLLFALICQYFASQCAYGFGTDLRKALYEHINTLSYSSIDRLGTSTLINRITNDTNSVQTGVNMFIRLAFRAPFLVAGAIVASMLIDLKLSIAFLIITPIISLIIYAVMSRTIPLYKKTQQKLDRTATLTRENLEGTRVIRAFSRQNDEIRNFNQACNDLSDNAILAGKISSILNPVTFMIMNLGIVAIIYFGGIRVDGGSITQGELTAFINYMTQILLALVVLANLIVTFTKAIASANRISDVFECQNEIVSGSLESVDEKAENSIEFENVSFRYNGAGDNSLENITFRIRSGGMLGIIGGTGSGKSTLSALIPRFYDADSGNIKIFGKDIKEYNTDFLRSIIGNVPQKAVLFTGTVRENMQLADENASDEEIIKALKIAQAWEFVEKLPGKLDTVISQGGKNLSGGQKQRIAIARAFIGSPKIVILDDSTSALDYATDLSFRKAIKENLKDTTIIMISQRATSLKDADNIIVMDDGKSVGTGTHKNLLENCEVYREIYNSQLSSKEGE
ncbi:MAG: ABC transporter ATP-binding protein [Ruminococcus sp.]|nr:ABC transporter ATP-binding protein [Oscillospiraceae bacterium]MDY4412881.1 ABC transporter ATP-binding protein [Ruminococcus sp.]